MMRIYLDNCCFNRPFDDQCSIRVRLETEAKLYIQERIRLREMELAWSYMLDYENLHNPFDDRRAVVSVWRNRAAVDVGESAGVVIRAAKYAGFGLKPKDALHASCAIESACDWLITTDDAFIKKARRIEGLKVVDPIMFVREVGI